MRIATWNVNSVTARLPRLLPWLAEAAPDVLCVQELKCASEKFPFDAVAEAGYESAAYGDGRWNGVAILSRVGLDDVVRGLPGGPGYPEQEPRAISATCGGVRVWSVYVPNGREVGHPHYEYKLEFLDVLARVAGADAAAGPTMVGGDFNVAPTDQDVFDAAAFVGQTHVTPAERQAMARFADVGLGDIMPRPLKYDWPFTFWDYRAGMFSRNQGMRIDFLLADAATRARVTDAYVDREARKGQGASDHAPVVVDLADSEA